MNLSNIFLPVSRDAMRSKHTFAKRQADMEQTGDQTIQFELTNLNQVLNMLEQRTQDLRVAENVAMQSLPMLKTMEFSNYNLIRKNQFCVYRYASCI